MSSLGDFDAGITLYGKFTTYQPSTGAPFALAGSPALSVYKDDSTTQSTSGITLTVSFDGVTGMNHYTIDLSSDGTFYAAGHFFQVAITTGTVDSVSVVGSIVDSFTIRANSALKPLVAANELDVDASGAAVIQGTVKKNTAIPNYPFLMRDTVGAPRTGLTVTAERKLDAGSFAACANSVSEIANGWYEIDLAAADLNGDTVALAFTATGSSGTYATILTVP